jgi:excisionase family DNA binding protein
MTYRHNRGRPVLGRLRIFPERILTFPDKSLTVHQWAELLNISPSTMYVWAKKMGIEKGSVRRPCRISRSDLISWLESHGMVAELPGSRRYSGVLQSEKRG